MINSSKNKEFIAHIREENGILSYQSVEQHLWETSALCEKFASSFGSGAWGKVIGLWHDIGKFTEKDFQRYIRNLQNSDTHPYVRHKPDHSSAGAILAQKKIPYFYLPIAYCITGHHSGLLDRYELDCRLNKVSCLLKAEKDIPNEIKNPELKLNVPALNNSRQELHLWIRMLFSCLVDADYLNTEDFMRPEISKSRNMYPSLSQLKTQFDTYISRFSQALPKTVVNRTRAYILDQCRKCGKNVPGMYSLTAPTGGGKTLSSVAWALEHALRYGKDRIIIAIPYTSIIAQTAHVLREIFGNDVVVEHHSQLLKNGITTKELLATENWDAPIIVTTNIQLFESLYACRAQQCRKIHNICNSIIILDEAQLVPLEYMKPILHVLQGLQASFRTSILFCSATQPYFEGTVGTRKARFAALEIPVHEIIRNDCCFSAFNQAEIKWSDKRYSFDDLAKELSKYRQVLCIVNTRKDAQEVFRRVPKDHIKTLHLSRMMCPAHVLKAIGMIKDLLKRGEPVRVISTQLIEIGVDVDFPVIYKAFAGLDSIVQAAGRCNREGKHKKGQVIVFHLEKSRLRGLCNKAANALSDLMDNTIDKDLLVSPTMLKAYFKCYFDKVNTFDKPDTEKRLYKDAGKLQFQFASYAKVFHLIEEPDAVSVLVNYEEGHNLIEELKKEGPTRELLRQLNRYCIHISKHDYEKLIQKGAIKQYGELSVLESENNYDTEIGMTIENSWTEEILFT